MPKAPTPSRPTPRTPMPPTPSTPRPRPLQWFDAHLDLAYLAELGRDMHAELDDCRGRLLPAAVTLPSLAAGRVGALLATVFTQPIPAGATGDLPASYPPGDAQAARRAGLRQLKLYAAWRDAGVIRPLQGPPPTHAHRTQPQPQPQPQAQLKPNPHAPRVGVLIENADPIESPDDLPEWVAGGVVAIGLTWAAAGRYAHGNTVPSSGPGSGLTDPGRAMVAAIDRAGLAHDLSHLNDRSQLELLDLAAGPVMASHSNARALLDQRDQRHLTDDAARRIAARGGVIGLNLYGPFLAKKPTPPTIQHVADHADHLCDAIGDRDHLGLGSDMDGGFSADMLPDRLRSPSALPLLADELNRRGWTDDQIIAMAWGNWARFFGLDQSDTDSR